MRAHDRRLKGHWGAFALGGVLLAACASESPMGPVPGPVAPHPPAPAGLESVTASALTDAARASGVAKGGLRVLSAEPVTWSDGSLGCPEAGLMYTQALVPGYRIRIEANGRVLDYHASRDGRLLLCPEWRAVPPVSDSDT